MPATLTTPEAACLRSSPSAPSSQSPVMITVCCHVKSDPQFCHINLWDVIFQCIVFLVLPFLWSACRILQHLPLLTWALMPFLCMFRVDGPIVALGSFVLFFFFPSFFLLRGFSSHMDQISPQIQNKVLNRGFRPVSPQSLPVQTEAITATRIVQFSRDYLQGEKNWPCFLFFRPWVHLRSASKGVWWLTHTAVMFCLKRAHEIIDFDRHLHFLLFLFFIYLQSMPFLPFFPPLFLFFPKIAPNGCLKQTSRNISKGYTSTFYLLFPSFPCRT